MIGVAIGPPLPLTAAMPGPIPPPHVPIGMCAALAAATPAPTEVTGKTMSTMAAALRCTRFWIAALAWSAEPCASMTDTCHPSFSASAVAALMNR